MPQVKTFSDSDSFTAFYALGEHRGDADGAVVSGSNMVTHFLVTKEGAEQLGEDCPRIKEAREIDTPNGKFIAVPYERPVTLSNYIEAHDKVRGAQKPDRAASSFSNREVLDFLMTDIGVTDKHGLGAGDYLVDPSVITELKSYYAKAKRAGRDDDIKEIRPDFGPSGDGKRGVS